MTSWMLVGGTGLILTAVFHLARQRSVHERAYRQATVLFRTTPANRRVQALRPLLAETMAKAAAWYLLGCVHLRGDNVREAARAFGMAYHGDDRLESAALLTFTCLKAGNDARSSLLSHAMITWKEMKEPDLPRTSEDRMLLECLEAEVASPSQSPPPDRLISAILGSREA